MQRTVWVFGLIAGLIVTVLMLGALALHKDNMDFKMGEIIGYLSMIIALSMIFFGVRSYRDRYLGGTISFGKAFQTGLLITLVASAIYVTGWMLYANFGPGQEFMDQYFEYTAEQLRQSGKPQEVVDREIARMEQFRESYRNPFVQIGFTFLEIFPVGLIITLISAFLLRKQRLG